MHRRRSQFTTRACNNELLFEAFVARMKKKVSFRLSFNIFKWQMMYHLPFKNIKTKRKTC